jgi:CHAT domain-containing protein/tetratricopeptide (TPR) repeat protein
MVVLTLLYRFQRLFAVILLSCSSYCQAQCVNRTELLDLVESYKAKPDSDQIKVITTVLAAWKRCRYPKDSLYVGLHLTLANAQFNKGDTKAAIHELEKIIQLYNKPELVLRAEDLVKTYYRMGAYWKDINEYTNARKASEQAIRLGERLPGNNWTAFAYHTLAYIYFSMGEYQKVVESSERGMYEAKRANDTIACLETWTDKIKALFALNKFEESKQELSVAISTARITLDAKDYLAVFLARKAKLDEINQNFIFALASYKEALAINQSLGKKRSVISNCIDIGYLYYQVKQYPNALTYYNRALKLVNDPYTKLRIYNNIGAVYWQTKQFKTALMYYQAGLNAVPLGFDKKEITALPDADMIYLASQKEYLLTLIQDKADTWLDYAKATGNDRNRLKAALATYNVADQMIDLMRWEHTGEQSKLFWRLTTRGLYERAIETCYLLGDAEQAFRFMEKSRSVMLADKVNELGARQQLTKEQLAEEQKLQQSVSSQQEKLADLSPDNSAAYNAARMALFAKQDSLNDFLKKLETTNPAYSQYKYDNKITSLADLQQYLKRQSSSLVTYFVGDSSLYVMSVTGDKTSLIKQPVGAYNQSLRQFSKLLSDPVSMEKREDVNRFLRLSHDLYRQLLAPLNLPKGRVVVSPDGFFVPFDALSRSTSQPDYAVADYAFSYVYSVGLLLKSNSLPGVVPSLNPVDFLGVAPVEFAPSLKQVVLPGSDAALEPIAGRFNTMTMLTHGDATRAAFLKNAANARIIHLFTHATADSSNREPSLYFADSALQLSDLSDQALPNAQMIVLAACKTGIGAEQRGEGVFSLARGFAALGVPSVLTTLWSVQNEATYELTDLFYQYLDQGLPKDIALQRAKTDWLKNAEGAGALPNYWAGLIIVGDPNPLLHLSYSPWVAILSVLAIVVMSAFWFWQKRERPARPQLSSAHSV